MLRTLKPRAEVKRPSRALRPGVGPGNHGQHRRGKDHHSFKGPITAVCSVPDCANTCTSHKSIYCKKHYDRVQRGNPVAPRYGVEPNGHCHYCGDAMPGTGPSRLYCSMRCSTRAKRRNPKTAICSRCGSEFKPYHKAKFCSQKCREDHTEERDRRNSRHARLNDPNYALKVNRSNHVRVERIRLALVERFSRLEILERDDWCCGICGHPIDKTLRWPHPQSGSVDHIKSLASGGEHSRANAQAAHLKCNQSKAKFDDVAKVRRISQRHIVMTQRLDAKARGRQDE